MTTPFPIYQVKVSTAKMPSKVKARYENIAILETDGSCEASMISPRARGVVRIVQEWARRHRGHGTQNSAAARAVAEAEALAAALNARPYTRALRVAGRGRLYHAVPWHFADGGAVGGAPAARALCGAAGSAGWDPAAAAGVTCKRCRARRDRGIGA